MKLASLKSGRDGRLVIVSRDLAHCLVADGIAPTLQAVLDDWSNLAPRLEALSARLAAGHVVGALPFDPRRCAAPLPRAYHWVDGSAYVNHVELVRQARGAAMPESFWTDPLVYQGASGTVSNRDRSRGSACLAERRTLEQIEHGAPRTPFLAFGDRVRVEMLDRAGNTVFGAIEQRVVPA